MWEGVTPEEGATREEALAEGDLFFKPALDQGAKMVRHDNTSGSAKAIIQSLMGAEPETLTIQHEMVEEKKKLLGSWLGNVDQLVAGVERVSFWGSDSGKRQ